MRARYMVDVFCRWLFATLCRSITVQLQQFTNENSVKQHSLACFRESIVLEHSLDNGLNYVNTAGGVDDGRN